MKIISKAIITTILLTSLSLFAKDVQMLSPLESGMLGYVDMREASLWVKGEPNSILYVELKNTSPKKIEIRLDEFGVGKTSIIDLKPNSEYEYSILDKDSKSLYSGKLKTSPDFETRTPPPDFSIAILGKCHTNEELYDKAYRIPGGEFEIFDVIASKKPAMNIWAANADNLRTADLGSKTGYYKRFINSRNQKDIKDLLLSVPNVGVMSINAYGAENADRTLWSRKIAQDAFKSFWPNPSYGNEDSAENYMSTVVRYGDAEFFIVDDCSQRDNIEINRKKREFIGAKQMNWLKQALQSSSARFKVVVMNTSVCNPAESKENFTVAKNEKADFLDFIQKMKISGIIFVSANKNYGEISRMVRPGAYPLFDITAGPTTAEVEQGAKEMNYFKVPASGVFKRSFVFITFSGKEDARKATVKFIDSNGKDIFTQVIDYSSINQFN